MSQTRAWCGWIASLLFVAGGSSPAGASIAFTWANPTPQGNGLQSVVFESPTLGYTAGDKGTTLRTTDAGQSWTDLTSFPQFTADLNDLVVLSPGVLLAAGAAPGLYRSNDGGASWQTVSNPANVELEDVMRVDASTLFAVGQSSVLRSTDNGTTWTARTSPGSGQLTDQFWLTPLRGFVLGAFILKQTSDGGQSWQTLPSVPVAFDLAGDIQFLDSQNGWIFHDFETWRTTNGGAAWTNVTHAFGHDPIYQDEAILLDSTHWLVATNGEGASIYQTTNAGVDWTIPYERQNVTGVSEMARLSSGFVAVTTAGDLLRSDSGASWTNFLQSPDDGERADIDALQVLSNGRAFAGGAGIWLESLDSGATWNYTTAIPGIASPLGISFSDDLHGLVGGYSNPTTKVGRTTDGGLSWSTHIVRTSNAGAVVGLELVTSQTAWVATYGGGSINFVFQSTDGGLSWSERMTGIVNPHRFFSLDFVDPAVGFVGGGEFGTSELWKTTNAGANWTTVPVAGIGGVEVQAMHWFSSTAGLVATDSGIYRTTNGGTNWSAVGAGARQMKFRDALHGVAGSIFGTVCQITSDGGASWQPLNTPSAWYVTSVFPTPEGCFIGTRYNSILHGIELDPAAVELPNSELDGALHGTLGPGVRLVHSTPNPGAGRLQFDLEAELSAPQWTPRASVHAIDGRRLAELAPRPDGAGLWHFGWDDASVGPGVYLVAVERGPYRASWKQVVVR